MTAPIPQPQSGLVERLRRMADMTSTGNDLLDIGRAADRIEELEAALRFYARGGDVADSEDVARGDVDLARVSEALTEDCGDVARAALPPKGAA